MFAGVCVCAYKTPVADTAEGIFLIIKHVFPTDLEL